MHHVHSLCVVVPVHKAAPSVTEAASLAACRQQLTDHPVYLVYPETISPQAYLDIHPSLKLQPVPAAWLASVHAYNQMKMDVTFYQLFASYEFLMTYELDAWIFSAAIEEHNGFTYDFIGAPIFEGFMEAGPDAGFLPQLNSGFSIRRVPSCLKALDQLRRYRSRWKLQRFFLEKFRFLRRWVSPVLYQVIFDDQLKGYFTGWYFHEDMIWTHIVPVLFPFFKVAPPDIAARFSFEVNAPVLLERQHGVLPLGCHAWAKFPAFWQQYIPVAKTLL